MPVRHTFSVDVDTKQWDVFNKAYDKFRKSLGEMPKVWSASTKESKGMEDAFKHMVESLTAMHALMAESADQAQKLEDSSRRSSLSWGTISSHAKSTYSTIMRIAKWEAAATAVTGLLGVGSLWGFEKLAGAASRGRRSSTGLGISYGGQQAFDITYGRFIDPASYLGAISQARGNVASPESTALYSLGIDPTQGTTGSNAKSALRRVYELARQTPENMLGPVVQQGYGAGSLGFSTEDLRRLKGMKGEDFDKYVKEQENRSQKFQVSDDDLRAMQNFRTELDAAGQKIESSLIRGLAKLGDPLSKVTDALGDTLQKFIGSEGFDRLMDIFVGGLKRVTDYLGNPSFEQDLKRVVDSMGYAANRLVEVSKFIGLLPTEKTEQQRKADKFVDNLPPGIGGGIIGYMMKKWMGASKSSSGTVRLPDGTRIEDQMPPGFAPGSATTSTQNDALNNPLSMAPGGKLAKYSTPEEGIKAAYGNLLQYQKAGITSLHDIIYKWTPPDDHKDPMLRGNNPDAVISNISKWTGFASDQQLNLSDPDTASKLMSAIARQENNYGKGANYTPDRIRVIIENKTGAAVDVSANGLGVFN